MSRLLEEYKDIYSGFLKRARSLIVDGYWHIKENRLDHGLKTDDFNHTQNATEGVLEALEILLSKVEGERDKPGVQPEINAIVDTINIHLNRIKKYYPNNDPKGYKSKKHQREEGKFQQNIFKGEQKIRSKIRDLNIENTMEGFSFEFFNDIKATIPFKKILCSRFPNIEAKVESLDIDWDLIISNEFHVNKHKKDIPEWKQHLHFWDQEKETLQYWVSEYNKLQRGITIDGVFIHPWLYYHINFFKTPIGDKNDEILIPGLRDNEWYLHDIIKYTNNKRINLKDAGMAVFGTRRYGKSTGEASWSCHSIVTNPSKNGVVCSTNEKDILALTDKIDIGITHLPPAFKLNMNSKDWTKQVRFGIKTKSAEEIKYFYLDIINLDSGSKRGGQKLAGIAPILFVLDEFAKEKFMAGYNALIPALETSDGWKTIPWLTGCLTAGNKVFTKDGNLINIEDLSLSDGIVGYNTKENSISFENITNINPPQDKLCYSITTNKGTSVECSFDHPFYIKHRNKRETVLGKDNVKISRRKAEFLEAQDLKEGMYLSLPDKIPLKGDMEMLDPYFIGAIIGDGNYSGDRGIRFYGEDDEIWDYFDEIGKDYTIFKEHKTIKNRRYREARFRGGMKYLKEIGIYGQSKNRKDLPKNIHLYSEKTVVELIAGLFDTDGTVHVSKDNAVISISQLSEKLIDSIKLLLLRLGIHSNKQYVKPDKRDRKIKSKNGYFKLNILDKRSMEIFVEKIPLKINRKKIKLKELEKHLKGKKERIDQHFPNMRFERITSIKKTGVKPVYNLTTSDTHTYLANGVITHNTGGDEDLSVEAEKALANPESHRIVEMDWRLLNWMVPKEFRTWTERPFGFFIPAQMGQRTGHLKSKTTLADFLGIESKELSKISIHKTDWETNTKVCRDKRKALENDRSQLQKEIVYYPLDPEECFMSAKNNPFIPNETKKIRTRLISEGNSEYGTSVPIELYRREDGTVYYNKSNKEVAGFPHPGGFIDSPFLLHGDFPENTPAMYRYIAGFDDYKHEESDGDSICGFYIFDRLKREIVLSLATRPDPHKSLHQQIHLALDAFNAKCFPENEDMDIKEYFDRIHKTDIYLAKSFDVYGEFSMFSTKRKYGWQPDKNTAPKVIGLVKDYVTEIFEVKDNDDNVIHTRRGVERIKDIWLLEELIKYKDSGNYDRLVGFGSCLLYDYWLTSNYIMPQARQVKAEKEDTNRQIRRPGGKLFRKKRNRLF